MLNNNFTLIGTAITNYEKVENSKIDKHVIQIEVERKKKNGADKYNIQVLGWNKTIDTTKEIVGETIIVNGYIDPYNETISLVAQDILVVDGNNLKKTKIEDKINPVEIDLDDLADLEAEPPVVEVDEDDLPF